MILEPTFATNQKKYLCIEEETREMARRLAAIATHTTICVAIINAHHAMADIAATKKCFFAMRKKGLI